MHLAICGLGAGLNHDPPELFPLLQGSPALHAAECSLRCLNLVEFVAARAGAERARVGGGLNAPAWELSRGYEISTDVATNCNSRS